MLEAVFGVEAAIELVAYAHEALRAHLEALMRMERSRYEAVLDGLGIDPDRASGLREAVREVEGQQ